MPNLNYPTAASQKVVSIWGEQQSLLDEGGLFGALSPTPGTAIAMTTSVVDDAATASSTHAQFAPAMIIANSALASDPSAVSIYPLYLKLLVAQVPTSATQWRYALRLDSVARYSSGGSQLTPVSPNPLSTQASKAQVYFGAIVPAALPSTVSRLVASGMVSAAIPTAADYHTWMFGPSTQTHAGSAPFIMTVPAIAIPPGWSLSLELWGASNAAAASFEVELVFAERLPGR